MSAAAEHLAADFDQARAQAGNERVLGHRRGELEGVATQRLLGQRHRAEHDGVVAQFRGLDLDLRHLGQQRVLVHDPPHDGQDEESARLDHAAA